MSKLNVFYENIKVGELHRNEDLVYSFQYSSTWLSHAKSFPLSLAMPLQREAFGNRITLSFFENLLPEGEVRNALGRSHNIENPFEFLKDFGQDCAGAVIVSQSEDSPFKQRDTKKFEISMPKIYRAIEQNFSVAQVIADMNPGYLSIAGAQDKFPAIFENGKFYLPTKGAPTTHIVKVPIKRQGIKESVYNEYFCMELGRAIGMNIPKCMVLENGAHPLYLIERYDREMSDDKKIRRIHQQDFCQAIGVVSDQKYESQGGPNLKALYDLIVNNVGIKNRVKDVYAFIDWICFNLLIGNNDGHAKNLSFLLKNNHIELAPFYDLLSTAVYPTLTKEFSFSIGGRNEPSKIGRNQFELTDKNLGLKIGTFESRMKIIHQKVLDEKDKVAKKISKEHKGVKIIQKINKLIEDRSKELKQQGVGLS